MAELTEKRAKFWRRHLLAMWMSGVLLVALAVLVGALLVLAHRAEPLLRARIVQGLSDHFHARVELDEFHVTLREGLWAEGKGLRIWPPAHKPEDKAAGGATPDTAAPVGPLIRLAEFRFHAPLDLKSGQAIRISTVQLKGLEVDIPPRTHTEKDAVKGVVQKRTWVAKTGLGLLHLNIQNIECAGVHLTIETSKPGKLPLEFAIAHLRLTGVGSGAMGFEAELTNPRPVGMIHTQGSFGPWVVEDPGETPIVGDYRFEHADLGGFKGVAGILNSTGHYEGTLRNMTVDGQTDMPDFQLTHFGTALELHTKFHARVDGTNGDTWLEPVEAMLGKSHFWARGRVVHVAAAVDGKSGPRFGGHEIALTVDVDRGRMEDFLRLASRSGKPLLTGSLTMKTGLNIQPGPVPVHERLKLKGTFVLDDAQFTSDKIQGRIAGLSARGLGHPKDTEGPGQANVRSEMSGSFQMANGIITLSALEYTVPGATINLKGSYEMDGGKLDFAGTAKMQATVSAMVGGWKGLLLKPMDRYFRKDGAGTVVPIHINGTRDDPQFGVDFNKMKKSSAQRPDETQ